MAEIKGMVECWERIKGRSGERVKATNGESMFVSQENQRDRR